MSTADKCTDCAVGYDSDSGKSECSACQDGYSSNVGVSGCSPCGKGTFNAQSNPGECKLCPIGKNAPNIATKTCANCPENEYQDLTGQESCKQCPTGYYSNDDKSGCTACDPGKYLLDNVCNDCIDNSYGCALSSGGICKYGYHYVVDSTTINPPPPHKDQNWMCDGN